MLLRSLADIFQFEKKSIISVSGAGGKTTFCKMLSKELSQKNPRKNILFSTTTKIKDFEEENFQKLLYDTDIFPLLENLKNLQGLYLLGRKEGEKLVSLPLLELEKFIPFFDYTILEADGSKRKPLKAWKENEPVYISSTTHSIGILPIKALGLEICEENIHRLEIFYNYFNKKQKIKVDKDIFCDLILQTKGLFQGAIGEKILFLNQVENEEERRLAEDIIKKIQGENFVKKIVYGSLHQGEFYSVF